MGDWRNPEGIRATLWPQSGDWPAGWQNKGRMVWGWNQVSRQCPVIPHGPRAGPLEFPSFNLSSNPLHIHVKPKYCHPREMPHCTPSLQPHKTCHHYSPITILILYSITVHHGCIRSLLIIVSSPGCFALTSPDEILSQVSLVAQSCPTLCDPMNRSTPGLPVHHQLPEFTQTHVHRVGDAIQPSHPLSSPSPPAPNPSQHQGLFQWVNSLHEVAKYWSFSFSISPSNEHPICLLRSHGNTISFI